MSKGLKVIFVMLGVFILSIVLAPPIDYLLPMYKFERVFNRLVMVFTIAAAVLFILLPKFKAKGGFFDPKLWDGYGFDFSGPWKRLLGYGFLAGAITVILMAAVEVAFGERYLRSPLLAQDIVERFFKGMLSGSIVGIVEEFFFRGFIFVNLRKKLNAWVALLLTSAFYSLCHFFNNGQVFIPENPSFGDGIRLLFGYLEPMLNQWHHIFPEFVGLFLFGAVLNLAFIRTRSLFLSIGIHAGAVFLIKFQYSFVREAPGDFYHQLFGGGAYYDGPTEWIILGILALSIWLLAPRFLRSPTSA